MTVMSVTQPTNGTAALGTAGANVTYTPNADYKGDDSFTYTVNDGTVVQTPPPLSHSPSIRPAWSSWPTRVRNP